MVYTYTTNAKYFTVRCKGVCVFLGGVGGGCFGYVVGGKCCWVLGLFVCLLFLFVLLICFVVVVLFGGWGGGGGGRADSPNASLLSIASLQMTMYN